MNNYYIYCISYSMHDQEELSITGHQEQPVFQISYKMLAAYVSKTSLHSLNTEYDHLKCHEDVISKIMLRQDALPMSFSTICPSEEKVMEMLRIYYDQFIENLEKLKGKIELGVKVFYKLNFEEEDKTDKELLKNPKEYMMKRYERYQNRQKKIKEILDAVKEEHKLLTEIAADSCYKEPMKNNLIFNASYLVKKEMKECFDQRIEAMKTKLPAYHIQYSGPWPAYHFISLVREGEDNE